MDDDIYYSIALMIAGGAITIFGVGIISGNPLGGSIALLFGISSLVAGIVIFLRNL